MPKFFVHVKEATPHCDTKNSIKIDYTLVGSYLDLYDFSGHYFLTNPSTKVNRIRWCRIITGHAELAQNMATNTDHAESIQITKNHHRLCRTGSDHAEQLQITQNPHRSRRTTQVMQNRLKSCKTITDQVQGDQKVLPTKILKFY